MAITIKVIDASALACFCFGEPSMAAVQSEFSDSALFAPAILEFELANICWKRLRRMPDHAGAILEQYAIRKEFPITIRAVAFDEVVSLAAQTSLTAYDASYLWLARRLRGRLITLDAKLARVATGL